MIEASYFTPGETVLLIGLIAHAIVMGFVMLLTSRQMHRDVEKIAQDVQAGGVKIEQVRRETDGMRIQLEAGARAEGKAAGVIEGRAEEKEDERKRRGKP